MWAEKQAQIKAGELTVEAFISENDNYIRELIENLDKNGINISSNATPCPVCSKGFLIKRKGQNGFFWGAHATLNVKHHSRIAMENPLRKNRLLRARVHVLVSPALPVIKRF